MRSAPFNSCDYMCETCTETDNCGVFAILKEKAASKHLPSEKPIDNPGSFLEVLRESLDEALAMLEQMSAGLDVEEGEVDESLERSYVDRDELYQLSLMFTTKTHAFLKRIEPVIRSGTRKIFDDLVWHHRLVSVKAHRAVASDFDGYSEDAVNSARVILKSLDQCTDALLRIGKTYAVAADECKVLSRSAIEIRRRIEKRFALTFRGEQGIE